MSSPQGSAELPVQPVDEIGRLLELVGDHIRAFSPNQRREAYERQKGICAVCGNHFELEEMEADHITPWHAGGRTEAEPHTNENAADDWRAESEGLR